MPLYSYRAVRLNGETEEGTLEALDEAALVQRLQAEGLIPVKTRPAGLLTGMRARRDAAKIGTKEIGLMTRQLATLLDAGLALDRAMQVLIELGDDEQMNALLDRVRERVRGGAGFSKALEEEGGTFPKLYVNMVRAGEAGGALEPVLGRLADYLERSAELRDTVKSALVYPMILLFVAGLSVILLLVFVVPQFTQMFDGMGAALPTPTRIVIFIGDLFRDYWWALLGVFAGGALVMQRKLEDPEFRFRWDGWILRLPVIGDLARKMDTARFCHTLSTLMQNGLTLLNALGLAKEVIGNRVIAKSVGELADELKHGRGLAGPLAQKEIFPRLAVQLISVGEESGNLEAMLTKVADIFDKETRSAVQRALTLFEPVIIITLGITVAFIIISILMAILGANELVF